MKEVLIKQRETSNRFIKTIKQVLGDYTKDYNGVIGVETELDIFRVLLIQGGKGQLIVDWDEANAVEDYLSLLGITNKEVNVKEVEEYQVKVYTLTKEYKDGRGLYYSVSTDVSNSTKRINLIGFWNRLYTLSLSCERVDRLLSNKR